ncbi:helicase-related protein [Planctellipticum variicoloris]|uniref:helicase-related protein n=1 Tax=Planctellipticum variicoloris TaxID=3064265 RepID=UPI003013220F|nr:hypothetical protein SH412_003763 [Planctomycetaceae bacterium SH412]
MPAAGVWLPFEEARTIVVSQAFKNSKDFNTWKGRPANVPSNPRISYEKDWGGWPYFLGTGPFSEDSRPKVRVAFLPFEEARALAQQLMVQFGITCAAEWNAWVKTADKPAALPADPYNAYKDKGWRGWPDWFNKTPARASGHEVVRSFTEARAFARTLNLKESRDWYEWGRTAGRPTDIPFSPDTRYRDEGWMGWADFLGNQTRLTHNGIVAFLRSLGECVETLTELDLYLILMHNGMLTRDSRLLGTKLLRGLLHARTVEDVREAEKALLTGLRADDVADRTQEIVHAVTPWELAPSDERRLRSLDTFEALKTVDRAIEHGVTDDRDGNIAIEFMLTARLDMLWQEAMNSGESTVLERLSQLPDGKYAQLIRQRFEQEYKSVLSLRIPDGYRIINAKDEPVALNIMQRLTAHRLLHRKRLGNWSGVGAGKTNAATFSAAIIDARLTLILAANSTLTGWKKTIRRAFDAKSLYIHEGHPLKFRFRRGRRNFLVVNYEAFQREWTDDLITLLCQRSVLDFVVFDEVQYVRQRHAAESRMSERRRQVNQMIRSAAAQNPNLRILAMSATPVVNNLTEAVKLLELVRPDDDFSQVPVGATIPNAVGVHFLLKRHGIRFVPRYDLQLEQHLEEIDGCELFEELNHLRPRDVLQMEQTLLKAKLRHLGNWVRRGTLVYTHFVTQIDQQLTETIEGMGLRVQQFTGKERVAVEEFVKDFRAGTADVLIGSSPVGTGVDGLQFVLDRIVFVSLPWSHAEYEQIIGRLWRQGSAFGKTEIIIPQVTLTDGLGNRWSWDEQRLRCLEYKETLADAALDGVIPRGGLPSPEEMQRRALHALHKWGEQSGRRGPQES